MSIPPAKGVPPVYQPRPTARTARTATVRGRATAAAAALLLLTVCACANPAQAPAAAPGGGSGAGQQVQSTASAGAACTFENYNGGVPQLDLKTITVGFAQSEKEANPFRITETESIKE